jgi:type I restriction enzyme, S subunit
VSQLPASWTLTTLGKVCRIVSGSTPKTGEPRYWGGNIAWITPDDLSKNRSKRVRSGARSISHEGYESCSARLLPEGTVLFTSRAPIGYVAIADRELCTNQGFKSLVPSDAVSSDYLYWYMRFATPDVRSRASGTTFLEISGRGIAEVPIPLPPRAQQECIVDAIEEEFSRLEAGSTTLDGIEGRAARIVRQVLDAALQREQGISVDVASLLTEPLANGRSVRDGDGYPVLRLDAINSGAVDLSRKKMGAWTGEEGRRFRVRVGDFPRQRHPQFGGSRRPRGRRRRGCVSRYADSPSG